MVMRLVAVAGCLGSAAAAEEPAPPSLGELVEAADLAALSASPDGRLVAYRTDRPSVARNSYDLTWHVVDPANNRRREIAGGGEPILDDPGLLSAEPPIWSPDGRWIYHRALRSGAVQIWRSAADGSGSQAVTAEAGDVLSMERAPDGGGILFRVGPPRSEVEQAELAEYDSGILVDEHVELGQNVFRGAIVHGRRSSQRLTGPWFSRGNVLWRREPRVRRLDFATLGVSDVGSDQAAAAPAELAEPPEAVATRGDQVAISLWDGVEGSLSIRRAGEPDQITCLAEECRTLRVTWVAWRPGHDEIVFTTSDRALVQTLRIWDIVSGEAREVVRGRGFVSGGRDENDPCAVTAKEAVCVLAAPNSPPHLEAIDLGSGAGRLLHDPNTDLRGRRWPWAERLAWRSAEGREFTGILFLPEPAPGRPLPLFINYYRCGGYVRGGVGDEWPFAALASAGIASVCVNATRIAGPQDGVAQYRAALAGIEMLVAILANRGLVDRDRVGMGGLSFGSEVILWTLMHSDIVSVASVASPQFEPTTYWFNNIAGRGHREILRRVWGLGSPEETPERWKLLSPALNVDRIRAPLLFQLPEQESRYAIEFYGRLSNSPTPTELYVFPDEPHIKVQPRHRFAVYRRNLDWFRFWLQGHEDPDSSKTEQYRRWRAMAERFETVGQAARARSQSSSEARLNRR